MEFVKDANAVHEAAHGYDLYKGTMPSNILDKEIKPYNRQYAFDPAVFNSSVPSYWGTVAGFSGITTNWVFGIHDSKWNYIYSSGVSSKAIEKYLDDEKKNKK